MRLLRKRVTRHSLVQRRLSVYALLLLMAVGAPSAAAFASENTIIIIRAVDGRTGKALENQHLLLFGGSSMQAAREQQQHYEIVTGTDGFATLTLAPETRWLQVWIDWHVLCAPKNSMFSVANILNSGISSPNTCHSALTTKAAPGYLVVFARPMHFWEKMRQ